MFIPGNFIRAIAQILDYILVIYMWIIVARAVLSWVNPDPYNPIVRFLHNVTEPVLGPIRSRISFVLGGLDISPIVVFIAIIFLRTFVVDSLYRIAATML